MWPQGRHRKNLPISEIYEDLVPGDYWRILWTNGEPKTPDEPYESNLTGGCWYVVIKMSYGYALGRLEKHTVREEKDGTISIRPGDGSSNSILISGHHGESWHGYVEHGTFSAC